VRHLILPGSLEDSKQVLTSLWNSFGHQIYLSLMVQYFPTYQTADHKTLGRRLLREEYEELVEFARKLGFRRGWIQQHEEENGLPLHCLP